MLGPLKNAFRAARGDQSGANGGTRFSPRALHALEVNGARKSRGLEEFFSQIHGLSGLTVLDLGGASQDNVSFITGLGHRFCSEDFMSLLSEVSGPDNMADQANPGRIEYFLKQALDYPDKHFDGVLIWDVLEYLAPPLLAAVVDRLHRIVRPGACMLAFFHQDDKLEAVPYYSFRIQDMKTLHVTPQGMRKPAQLFNNRSLEKMFSRADSIKFFLTKDRLREVVIKA